LTYFLLLTENNYESVIKEKPIEYVISRNITYKFYARKYLLV